MLMKHYLCIMKGKIFVFVISGVLFTACVTKKDLALRQDEINRLKNDSTLLEKRIRGLQDENNRLSTTSATMEQSLNERLQEKEDALNQKQRLINDRENTLKDLKARKEEEREAFSALSKNILAHFTDYDVATLTTQTTCTQIQVMVNDKKLFSAIGNNVKTEYLANEITQKSITILDKYPDVHLIITATADTIGNDPLAAASLRSNLLLKQILQTRKDLSNRIKSASQPSNKPTLLKVEYSFYSNLLPCTHTK